MRLALQFGYGMMEHCRSLLETLGGGTVILSPRDVAETRQSALSQTLRDVDGSILLDPQFYLPHRDHPKLKKYSYWPGSYDSAAFWTGAQLSELIQKLLDLNATLQSSAIILPGLFGERVDDDWLDVQKQVVDEGRSQASEGQDLYATIALSAEAVRNNDQVHGLLDDIVHWDIDGVYLVCEHPKGAYLVEDASWLTNMLDIVASLRLKGKYVILGYCNHQSLIAACAGVNEIASGTWMNVRMFPPEKFWDSMAEEQKQRATWFYAPAVLSEFTLDRLDLAQRMGLLDSLNPDEKFGTLADILFSGGQPSVSGFGESNAFRHYLHCMHVHACEAVARSFKETVAIHMGMLQSAERLLQALHDRGINGRGRDFYPALDGNRAALAALKAQRGSLLERAWPKIAT